MRTGQVSIECALKRQTVCVCAATWVKSPSNALQAVLADRTCGGSRLARLLLDDLVIVWRQPDAKMAALVYPRDFVRASRDGATKCVRINTTALLASSESPASACAHGWSEALRSVRRSDTTHFRSACVASILCTMCPRKALRVVGATKARRTHQFHARGLQKKTHSYIGDDLRCPGCEQVNSDNAVCSPAECCKPLSPQNVCGLIELCHITFELVVPCLAHIVVINIIRHHSHHHEQQYKDEHHHYHQ